MNKTEDWILNYLDNKRSLAKKVIVEQKKNRSYKNGEKNLEKQIYQQIKLYLDFAIKEPSCWHNVEVSNNQRSLFPITTKKEFAEKTIVEEWPSIEIFWRPTQTDYTKMVFLEVKIPGKDVEPYQADFHNKLRARGHKVFVVHSEKEVKENLKNLGVV